MRGKPTHFPSFRSRDGAGPAGLCSVLFFLLLAIGACTRSDNALVLASTSSLEDSGLLEAVVAAFEAESELALHVTAVGSGQALALGARGDADVLLVHAPAAEAEFMASGRGEERREVAWNEFVIAGPAQDPAGVRDAPDAHDALRRIARAGAPFLSRGDDSGTHALERALWRSAGIEPAAPWYREVGQGMAETLGAAAQRRAYTLSDAATLRVLAPLAITPLFTGDALLRNTYSVIVVKDARNARGARAFAAWLTGRSGQALIAGYGRDRYGSALYRLVSADSGEH